VASAAAGGTVEMQGVRDLASAMLAPCECQMYKAELRPLVAPLTFRGR
jgi:hypothetical protein